MQTLATLGTITVIHLLGVMSPGPDLIMAIRNSLTYSRKTGIYTAIGFALGIIIHIAYSLAGVAIIISQSILLFNAIKILGAIYLIYIGVKSIRARSSAIQIEQQEKKKDISAFQAIKIGFITNVLNPKATLYFLSLFTLVISPDTPALTLALASIIMVVLTALWFSLVSIFMTQAPIRAAFNKYQNAFNKTFGGLLIALGLKVATSTNE